VDVKHRTRSRCQRRREPRGEWLYTICAMLVLLYAIRTTRLFFQLSRDVRWFGTSSA